MKCFATCTLALLGGLGTASAYNATAPPPAPTPTTECPLGVFMQGTKTCCSSGVAFDGWLQLAVARCATPTETSAHQLHRPRTPHPRTPHPRPRPLATAAKPNACMHWMEVGEG
jgi:hypothetical protein